MLQFQTILQNEVPPRYKPGDLTNKRSYTSFVSNDVKPLCSVKGYPLHRDDFSDISTKPEKNINVDINDNDETLNNPKEMINSNTTSKQLNQNLLSPIINAISNFSFAKKLHRENLEHFPLPDTITNAMYRKLQMQKQQECDPGLVLDDKAFACGVGWKGYPGYGPTRCTKLKVYRPKTTCGHKKDKDDELARADSFERKWRFIRQTKVSPIDLAICWDLTPVNVEDEPKPSIHIDGSNGSQAPAVFQLVHSHREEQKDVAMNDEYRPIFDYIATMNTAKRFIPDRPKTSLTNINQHKNNKRIKSAEQLRSLNLNEEAKLVKPCNQHTCKKLNQRLCVACELKSADDTNGNRHKKTEYKMAFKAGVPQKNVSRPSCRIRVPRQKAPYKPLNYGIHSLVPPFSLQKNRREDYPEHWRLATVYQHSFKPLHARKKPLLQTVYL